MTEYKALEKKRTVKQFFMAIIFLIIIIGGWRYPLLGYFIPLCMLLGIGLGLFRGRQWCDWLCPRGSFFDSLIKPISQQGNGLAFKIAKAISPKKEIPKFFKGLALRVGMLSFLMAMMGIQLIKRWPDPYKIGKFFVVLLTITTVLGVILAIFFHQRTWCCFCPIGTMANWAGKRRYLLRIDSKSCTECKLCYKVCPIQIAPYKFKKDGIEIVKDGDCLKCGLCVSVCPQKSLDL